MGRVGSQEKSISVTVIKVLPDGKQDTAVKEQYFRLTIKGNILPRPIGIEDWFPVRIGNLRFNTSYHNFGKVKNNEEETTVLKIYNQASRR